jgi:hypothetical protein
MGRAVLLGWVGLGLLGSAAFAACLPEVTVDEALGTGGGPETGVGAEKDGSGGSAGKGPNSAGAGGGAGTASMPNNPGSGGSAGTGSMETAGGVAGAAVLAPGSAGAGGAAGMGGTGGAGAGAAGTSGAAGAGGVTAMGRCEANQSREEACGNYCQMYSDACSDFTGVYTYTDVLNCTDICNNSDWPIGNITEKGSVLCRCYHAYRALTEGQTPHCYHAAEVPSMANGCAL